MAFAFSIPALSRSKCRYLQSLLQCVKANALRLNELSHTELMYIAAFTPAKRRNTESECHRHTLGAGCHLPKRHKQTSVFLTGSYAKSG